MNLSIYIFNQQQGQQKYSCVQPEILIHYNYRSHYRKVSLNNIDIKLAKDMMSTHSFAFRTYIISFQQYTSM